MRIIFGAAALFMSMATISAHAEPVFRSVAEDPSLQLPADAPRVEVPATAPQVPERALPTQQSGTPAHRTSRAGEEIDSEGSGAIPALSLEATTENGITYVSGGISGEEVEQLKANEHQFNILLRITGAYGEYVSDVNVKLRDASGAALVSVDDAGPYLYFQVPSGRYTADIGANGDTTKSVTLNVIEGKTVKHTARISAR